jgi:hypothetical protein
MNWGWKRQYRRNALKNAKAWQFLEVWLITRGNAPEDYRWLCSGVAAWEDARYLTRFTQEFVDRLLMLKRNGEALDVVARRLTDDPAFRPKSAAATLDIARIAASGGMPRVARMLLADFPTRFAGDPSVVFAEALGRQLGP